MRFKNIIRNFVLKNKCLYCDNRIWNEDEKHFISCCCGRGMCEKCFGAGVGTMEQFQVDYMDEDDYEVYVRNTNVEGMGDYICFECCDNGNIYHLKK